MALWECVKVSRSALRGPFGLLRAERLLAVRAAVAAAVEQLGQGPADQLIPASRPRDIEQ